ncbi:MAG: glutaminyl-peptide cyclotransferase [Proteobacteria bacterium]|nr:glutaminyl-peptide cyclotransferase [Pseudomonadota bacterium]
MTKRLAAAFAVLLLLSGAAARAGDDGGHVEVTRERVLNQSAIPVYGYRIVRTYPHDTSAYTEGLVMQNGTFYEGTGLYGRSKLRQWEPETGKVLHETDLDPRDFGEGVTVLGNTIYQLTYLANQGFRYDRATFRRTGGFRYLSQGWGLTTDGTRLIMSNGSSAIAFLDPRTLAVRGQVYVTDNVGPVGFLNELEWANGKLYANVWQTDFIAIIAPSTGKITGWIDLTGLNPDPKTLVYPLVLNGIAYDARTGHLLVTGKCWPHVWEIELVPRT